MTASPRILMLSQRNLAPVISRCTSYELEDVVCAVDAVDFVAPAYRDLGIKIIQPFEILQLIVNRLGERTAAVRRLNPGIRSSRAQGRYDLFFSICQFVTDLPALNALQGWRECSRTAACWIEEIWARDIPRMRSQLALLRQFDYLFVGCRGSVEPLQEATGRPCVYLPPGVDCLRFVPGQLAPPRVIDVYAMGRRHPDTHAALLEWARGGGHFYLHDTFRGNVAVGSPAAHRDMLAGLIKRTRYFLANRAKVDVPGETEGQQEVGFRFFEGAAAGVVMIGEPPNVASFSENFDWPDAVVRLPLGSTEIGALIDELERQPERVARIRRDNVANALRRHDWVYRWNQVLEVVGLEPTAAARNRQARLAALAGAGSSGASPGGVRNSAESLGLTL